MPLDQSWGSFVIRSIRLLNDFRVWLESPSGKNGDQDKWCRKNTKWDAQAGSYLSMRRWEEQESPKGHINTSMYLPFTNSSIRSSFFLLINYLLLFDKIKICRLIDSPLVIREMNMLLTVDLCNVYGSLHFQRLEATRWYLACSCGSKDKDDELLIKIQIQLNWITNLAWGLEKVYLWIVNQHQICWIIVTVRSIFEKEHCKLSFQYKSLFTYLRPS